MTRPLWSQAPARGLPKWSLRDARTASPAVTRYPQPVVPQANFGLDLGVPKRNPKRIQIKSKNVTKWKAVMDTIGGPNLPVLGTPKDVDSNWDHFRDIWKLKLVQILKPNMDLKKRLLQKSITPQVGMQ